MAESLPRDFGPYVLQRLISDEGGQGRVYLATHKSLGRVAVIKLLRQHLAEHPSFVERFAAEAAQLAKMDHANIVRVRQSGPLEGQFFIEMEYVEGWDLGAWIKAQGAVPYEVALEMLQRIAAGLEHAHARFVIHRDVKPGNVILTPGGEVKVLDFGLARDMDTSGASSPGTLVGTVAYMSPEQVDGAEATEAFDIYALGVVAYQLLSGRLPFEGGLATVCMKIRSEPPPPLQKRCPEVPAAFVNLVNRLMAKQPGDRPAEMRGVEAELRELALSLGLRASDDLLPRYVADPGAVVRELQQRRRARALRSRMPWLIAGAVTLVAAVVAAFVLLRPPGTVPGAEPPAADSSAVPAVTEVLAAPETLATATASAALVDTAVPAAPRPMTDAAVPLEEEPVVPAPVTPPAPSGTLPPVPAPVVHETETDSPDSLVVEVEVQPASDVYLDGALVASGVTSFQKRMLRKAWQVRVDGGAYGVRDQKKKPRPGDRRLSFSFKLSAGVGGVHVIGPRNGLDIYIDGVYQHAVTPAPVRPVPVGTHTIEVRDRRTGAVVASRQVVVKQDSNNLEVDLSAGH